MIVEVGDGAPLNSITVALPRAPMGCSRRAYWPPERSEIGAEGGEAVEGGELAGEAVEGGELAGEVAGGAVEGGAASGFFSSIGSWFSGAAAEAAKRCPGGVPEGRREGPLARPAMDAKLELFPKPQLWAGTEQNSRFPQISWKLHRN